jgi:adenosylcobinamide-GDP ribazoletransferase
VMAGSDRVGHSALLAAALGITTVAVLTRGLHLDGLADTADGLGSRRPAEGALAVMRSGDVGPFGVATLVLVLVLQIAGAADGGPAAVVVAVATGRVAVTWACRRGAPAARQGLGSLVASTVHPAVAAAVVVVAAGAALVVGPLGPAAVLAGVAVAELAVRVCVRRLGGVTGDVLGACCELAVATSLAVLAAG